MASAHKNLSYKNYLIKAYLGVSKMKTA